MKKLLTALIVSLATTTAFANEFGTAKVTLMKNAKMAVIEVTGSAAASLYNLMNVRELPSKTNTSGLVKEGNQMTCFSSPGTIGEMISPVVPIYRCSLIVNSQGDVNADSEVQIEN